MTQTTSPDNIVKWTNSDPASLPVASQAQGDSVQAALNNRERYDFVWANSGERAGQSGMVQGSRGYQVDTRTEYIYDNSVWRLSTPHAEYTFSATPITSGGSPKPVGNLTFDATQSTSTTFTTTSASPATGQIIVTDPGIYAYTGTITNDGAVAIATPGRGFIELSFDSNTGNPIKARVPMNSAEDKASLSMANVRTVSANQSVFLRFYQQNGSTINISGRIMITRLG